MRSIINGSIKRKRNKITAQKSTRGKFLKGVRKNGYGEKEVPHAKVNNRIKQGYYEIFF